VFEGAQIAGIEKIRPVFVFLYQHLLAGTLRFFQQPGFLRRAFGVEFRRMYTVCPAAGVGACALVDVAMVEITGKQAAAGIGHAESAVHENFQFDVRTALADFGNVFQRQFARENDALYAHFCQKRAAAQLTVLACTERARN
jgi:hypothetical protein